MSGNSPTYSQSVLVFQSTLEMVYWGRFLLSSTLERFSSSAIFNLLRFYSIPQNLL